MKRTGVWKPCDNPTRSHTHKNLICWGVKLSAVQDGVVKLSAICDSTESQLSGVWTALSHWDRTESQLSAQSLGQCLIQILNCVYIFFFDDYCTQ